LGRKRAIAATGRSDANMMANIFIVKLQLSVMVSSRLCAAATTLVVEHGYVTEHAVKSSASRILGGSRAKPACRNGPYEAGVFSKDSYAAYLIKARRKLCT
jgi:hypothetical protein